MKKNKLLVVALVPMLCACSFSATEYSASQFKKLYDEQIAPKQKTDFVKGDQISFTKHVVNNETNMKDYEHSLKTRDYPAYKERFGGAGNENSPLWKEYFGGGISFSDSYKYTLGSAVFIETTKTSALAYEEDEGRIREDQIIDGKTEKVDVGTFESKTFTYTKTVVNQVPDEKGELVDFVNVSIEYKYTVRVEKNLDGEKTITKTIWEANQQEEKETETYEDTYVSVEGSKINFKATLTVVKHEEAYEGDYPKNEDEVIIKLSDKTQEYAGRKPFDGDSIGELAYETNNEQTVSITTADKKTDGKIVGHTYKRVEDVNGVETVDDNHNYEPNYEAAARCEPMQTFKAWDEDANITGAIENLKTVYNKAYSDASAALNGSSKEKECLVKGDNAVIRIKESSSTMVEYQFDKKTGQPTRIVSYSDVDFNKLGVYTVKEDASFVY